MINHPNRSRVPAEIEAIKARIVVNSFIGHQPPGSHGFRRGNWTYLLDGEKRQIFMSVPHASETATQYGMVRHAAATAIYDQSREG